MSDNKRVKIIVKGLVQGVGFRWFVVTNAKKLGLKGYVQNLYNGDVLTVAEGEYSKLEELVKLVKVGPSHSQVNSFKIDWEEFQNEFKDFEVKYS